jgi:ABC-type siderophore export system fused ATPase/permease subunit
MRETIKRFTTPKQTKDWYIKWSASVLLLTAMVLRATGDYPFTDMCLSLVGCIGWLVVAMLWKDRALIVLNSIAAFILMTGILNSLVGKL